MLPLHAAPVLITLNTPSCCRFEAVRADCVAAVERGAAKMLEKEKRRRPLLKFNLGDCVGVHVPRSHQGKLSTSQLVGRLVWLKEPVARVHVGVGRVRCSVDELHLLPVASQAKMPVELPTDELEKLPLISLQQACNMFALTQVKTCTY